MAGLKNVEGYVGYIINICPNNTDGEIIEIGGLKIQLPKLPKANEILFHDKPKEMQMWQRLRCADPAQLLVNHLITRFTIFYMSGCQFLL